MVLRNNKHLNRVLVAALLSVWGIVAYKIIGPRENSDEGEGLGRDGAASSAAPPQVRLVYAPNVRDPFQFVRAKPKVPKGVLNLSPQKRLWTAPPYKLTGILSKKKRATVTLEGLNGKVFFLSEGDTLSGLRIVKILAPTVSYTYQKKKASWSLE